MKKILSGSSKGYLMKCEEFEDRIWEEYPDLKGYRLGHVYVSTFNCQIELYEQNKNIIEEKGSLVLPTAKLQKIIGIGDQLTAVSKNTVKNEKMFWDEFSIGDNLYYFFRTDMNQVFDYISEL